jgi:hypothetical protein
MPGQRPFQTHSLDKLFLLAREYWDTIPYLEIILDELANRTTPGAKAPQPMSWRASQPSRRRPAAASSSSSASCAKPARPSGT